MNIYRQDPNPKRPATQKATTVRSNPALNPVRFALWTLRDKAAQSR
jgi:hypothetical protein